MWGGQDAAGRRWLEITKGEEGGGGGRGGGGLHDHLGRGGGGINKEMQYST